MRQLEVDKPQKREKNEVEDRLLFVLIATRSPFYAFQ